MATLRHQDPTLLSSMLAFLSRCTLFHALFAGDQGGWDEKRRRNVSQSAALAALIQKIAQEHPEFSEKNDDTPSEEDEKELVAAKTPEHELKVRRVAAPMTYDLGPSVYPTDPSSGAPIDPIMTITRKPQQESGTWLATQYIYDQPDQSEGRKAKGLFHTAIVPASEPQHLFMSNGTYAIAASRHKQLTIHHWLPRKPLDPHTGDACEDMVHVKTRLPGDRPGREFLCTINQKCTRAMAINDNFNELALYDIQYHPDGTISRLQHTAASDPDESILVPLCFKDDYECIALGLNSATMYRINTQYPSDITTQPYEQISTSSIQKADFSFHHLGLKVALRMADDRLIRIDAASGKPEFIKAPRLRKDAVKSDDHS